MVILCGWSMVCPREGYSISIKANTHCEPRVLLNEVIKLAINSLKGNKLSLNEFIKEFTKGCTRVPAGHSNRVSSVKSFLWNANNSITKMTKWRAANKAKSLRNYQNHSEANPLKYEALGRLNANRLNGKQTFSWTGERFPKWLVDEIKRG